MKTDILMATQRGQMNEPVLQGHIVFSNGQRNTDRPHNFGAVFVFNDDTMRPGAYLGMHPHTNVEIVTVVVDGIESHADNLGYKQELTKGDVQLISAGAGISHAGGNISPTEDARHLQIWISPRSLNTKPAVQLKRPADDPVRNRWQPLVSPDGSHNTLRIQQDVWLFQGTFDPGIASYIVQKPGHGIMLYVLTGRVKTGGNILSPGDTAFITQTNAVGIDVEEQTSLLLIETRLV